MKRLIALLLWIPAISWGACNTTPFAPNQILTASALNSALNIVCVNGGSIDSTPIGQTLPSAGAFTSLSSTLAPSFGAPVPLSSGGTGQTTAAAAAHALNLGVNDSPTFFGLIVNGSAAHGVTIGGGNGTPFTWTAAGTSGLPLLSGGSLSDPAYGQMPLSSLASQAANTVVGNATGSSAVPTAITVTGCNGAAQALQWTNGSGFGCNSGIATSGANANITSLTGLTTPLATGEGGLGVNNSAANGIPVFVSGTATVTAVTGSGAPVLATSPTITTPAIVGPTNGVAASAGNVGEVICAQVTNGGTPTGCATNSSTPVSLSSGITSNVTSITLTAGNWRVWGQVLTIPAGTTTQSVVNAAISPTTVSFAGQVAEFLLPFSAPAGAAVGGTLDPMPIRVTTNTTYYLIVNSTFAVSTNTAIGFIAAQRTN